jgi:hypothetical protein
LITSDLSELRRSILDAVNEFNAVADMKIGHISVTDVFTGTYNISIDLRSKT